MKDIDLIFLKNGVGLGSTKNNSYVTKMGNRTEIGKYHNLYNGNPPYISPQINVFNLDEYPLGDNNNPSDYATVINEPKSISNSEIVAVNLILENLTEGGNVTFDWYRNEDNKLLISSSYEVPNPSVYGYDKWLYYSVYNWIGKFPNEINKIGTYHVDIVSPWITTTISFEIVSSIHIPQVQESSGDNLLLIGGIIAGFFVIKTVTK